MRDGEPAGTGDAPGAEIVLPRLGPLGWLRWAWRQLTSMRTALLLLMLLALAAVPGSVFPQNRVDPAAVEAYRLDHPDLAPWVQRLGGFDVYSSPWFSAVYILLFVSLVGCVLPRARRHWQALRAAPPRTPRRLDRLPAHAAATTTADAGEVLAAAHRVLRARRYRVAGHDGSVAAERGRHAETGNLVFHLALLGVLGSVAAGSFLAYSGQTIVVAGDTFVNTLPGYDTFERGRAVDERDLEPFTVRLDDLQVRFEEQAGGNQFGAPREFTARVTFRERPGAPAEQRVIRVNEPLDVGTARVFLLGNGYAPVLTVRDGAGDVAWQGPVVFRPVDGNYTSNGVLKAPDARPEQLGLVGFLLPTAALTGEGQPVSVFPDLRRPRLLFTAYTGDLGIDAGVPQSVYVLDVERMEQLQADGEPFRSVLAPGQSATLPGGAGTVTFDGVRRYAALEVRADPTTGWVLTTALLALAGLTASLFVRRRRVWVRAVPGAAGRTVVEVGGLARTEDQALAAEVRRLLAEIAPDGVAVDDRSGTAGAQSATADAVREMQ